MSNTNDVTATAAGSAAASAQTKKRYALVGTGARGRVFIDALVKQCPDKGDLVAFCDISPTRMAWHNNRLQQLYGFGPLPTYAAEDFEKMLREQRVDTVIITTPDYTHHQYIIRTMEAGCDAIVEKPLTIDADKARAIQEVMKRTGRKLRVTFNYRYQPMVTKARELLMQGVVGQPLAVTISYALDTRHGTDYFRRWHRDKANSGGLVIHKATHQFDMVNWLLQSVPEKVFAFGAVKFYGKAAAEARGERYEYERYTGQTASQKDPFAMQLDGSDYTRGLYMEAEADSGYIRDKNVFGDGVTTEDTLAVVAQYRNGVIFNYNLVAYSPQEGFDLYITGTKGRLELRQWLRPHALNEDRSLVHDPTLEDMQLRTLRVLPMFGVPYEVEIPYIEGGHGGGDTVMAEHLFDDAQREADPFKRAASYRDGLASLAMGMAANQSMATGQPVVVSEMIDLDS